MSKVQTEKIVVLNRKLSAEEVLPETYTGQGKKVFTGSVALDAIEEAMKRQAICRAEIVQVDRDKAYVDYEGVRGFIPKEELDTRTLKGLIGFVGRPIAFVIRAYDPANQLFVASRNDALELMRDTTFEQLEVGQVRAGTVVRVENWGCLMDLGGVLGRLSKADMLHTFVNDPHDVVARGDYFDVMISKVSRNDKGEERVVLSLKNLIPVPWDRVTERYKVDAVSMGKVSGFLTDTKVFIELEKGIEGLSDIPEGMKLEMGQKVRARIGKIDANRQRIRLKIIGVITR